MAYQIRELRLGGILDQGIAVVKDNFGLLFGILLCVCIPYQWLVGLVQLAHAAVATRKPHKAGSSQSA